MLAPDDRLIRIQNMGAITFNALGVDRRLDRPAGQEGGGTSVIDRAWCLMRLDRFRAAEGREMSSNSAGLYARRLTGRIRGAARWSATVEAPARMRSICSRTSSGSNCRPAQRSSSSSASSTERAIWYGRV